MSDPRVVPLPGPASTFDARRARGALLGLAVGDALGSTTEFARLVAPAFPALATGPHRAMAGGGPFALEPGQVTDDTEMAVCLAESLMAADGLDVADARSRYRAWSLGAFDVGIQTRAILRHETGSAADAVDASRRYWLANGRRPAGNGSLMRTAPLGVAFHADLARVIEASLLDSAITHFDPRCRLACAALNASIARAVSGSDTPTRVALTEAALAALATATDVVLSETDDAEDRAAVARAQSELAGDLAMAQKGDPDLYGALHLHDTAGFVRVALRLAYWELWHARSFEEALVDVVNRGGDADTNGAITGALLGAFFGDEAVPREWTETVLEPRAGRRAYHPERLAKLVDAVGGLPGKA